MEKFMELKTHQPCPDCGSSDALAYYEWGDVELKSFTTKKEAEEELENREQLTQHVTGLPTERVYQIKKG